MTSEECPPASAKVVYAPQWLLNTINAEQGDRVCVHSLKDTIKRGKALKVVAVL
jgi:hypothetical protein